MKNPVPFAQDIKQARIAPDNYFCHLVMLRHKWVVAGLFYETPWQLCTTKMLLVRCSVILQKLTNPSVGCTTLNKRYKLTLKVKWVYMPTEFYVKEKKKLKQHLMYSTVDTSHFAVVVIRRCESTMSALCSLFAWPPNSKAAE